MSGKGKSERRCHVLIKMFEPTCAYAWWAHMHCFPSVCPSVCHWTKNQTRKKFISQKVLQIGVWKEKKLSACNFLYKSD